MTTKPEGAQALMYEMTKMIRELAKVPTVAKMTGPEALTFTADALDAWIPEVERIGVILLVEGEDAAQKFATEDEVRRRVFERMGLK